MRSVGRCLRKAFVSRIVGDEQFSAIPSRKSGDLAVRQLSVPVFVCTKRHLDVVGRRAGELKICNQAFFGDQYYKMSDEYPLFYISMEHKNVHSTIAFRIYSRGGVYHIEEIQTIKLVFDKEEDTIYYPNSYYDFDEGLIYYGGYTESNYMRSESNKLKYYSFPMPSYREEYYELHTDNPIDSFILDSETATQGGFISHNHLYQTFSFGSKTDPLRAPAMRVVDLRNKTIIKEYKNLGEQFGVYTEFEHLALNDKGRIISLGNPFDIYEFEYKG